MRRLSFLTAICSLGTVVAADRSDEVLVSPAPLGAGARALGMGGAFAAIADDATANTWNPAGMAQLDRPEVSFSAGWYRDTVALSRDDAAHQTSLDIDHLSAVLPYHALGFQQTIGLAWQRQYDFNRQVTVSLPKDKDFHDGTHLVTVETDHIQQDGAFASTSLSWAIDLHPQLSIGVTGHVWDRRFTGMGTYRQDKNLTVHQELLGDPEDTPTLDTVLNQHQQIDLEEGYSFAIGLLWRPLAPLTVGVVVKPEYRLDVRTRRTIEQSSTLNGEAQPVPPSSSIEFREHYYFPTSATLGLAWRQTDSATLACDVGWTHWSAYRVEQAGIEHSPISVRDVHPDDYHDLFSVRLGYEQLVILPRVVLVGRLGAAWEPLPGLRRVAAGAPLEAATDDYYAVTTGVSVCFRHLIYDVAAQYRWANSIGAGTFSAKDQVADIRTLTIRLGVAWQW